MKFPSLLATALLGFAASQSTAAINIAFVYDSGTDTTTASYSGSWDVFNDLSPDASISYSVDKDYFRALDGNSSWDLLTLFYVETPWTNSVDATSHSGDNFAFTVDGIYAPSGYTAGESITGALVFAGSDLGDLGFAPGDINSSGILSNNGNTMNWSSAVVPEPTTYALLAGIGALMSCLLKRPRR